jgi:hypothetical protein
VKISLSDDPLLNEFKNVTKLAIKLIDKENNTQFFSNSKTLS